MTNMNIKNVLEWLDYMGCVWVYCTCLKWFTYHIGAVLDWKETCIKMRFLKKDKYFWPWEALTDTVLGKPRGKAHLESRKNC